jgi:hypothetical protein
MQDETSHERLERKALHGLEDFMGLGYNKPHFMQNTVEVSH